MANSLLIETVLGLLYTIPEYRQRGCASLLVEEGAKIADDLLIPSWSEAAPHAVKLYEKFGYETLEKISFPTSVWTHEYVMMKRPAKTSREVL
jgi:GNAT superfamily N-acetyltransferase